MKITDYDTTHTEKELHKARISELLVEGFTSGRITARWSEDDTIPELLLWSTENCTLPPDDLVDTRQAIKHLVRRLQMHTGVIN